MCSVHLSNGSPASEIVAYITVVVLGRIVIVGRPSLQLFQIRYVCGDTGYREGIGQVCERRQSISLMPFGGSKSN